MKATPSNSHASATPPRGSGEVILVVDDEKSVLNLVTIILELGGYKVITADSPILALGIYEKQSKHIAAVVLDLAMPNMDGIRLSRMLLEINPQARIIISSGQTTPPKELELKNMGIRHFLPKPYNVAGLLTMLSEVIHAEAGATL